MNVQLAITVLTIAAFVGMAIYLLTVGRKIQFPKGDHVQLLLPTLGLRAELIFDPALREPARRDEYQTAVMAALFAAADVWSSYANPGFGAMYPHIVVNIKPTVYRNYHGVQTYAKAKIGKARLPMLIIEEGNSVGHLVIHEAGHLLATALSGEPDRHHVLNHVWAVNSDNGYEARAQRNYDRDAVPNT